MDAYPDRLLRFDELAIEQLDQHVALTRTQCVLAQLEDCAAVTIDRPSADFRRGTGDEGSRERNYSYPGATRKAEGIENRRDRQCGGGFHLPAPGHDCWIDARAMRERLPGRLIRLENYFADDRARRQ